ncbi:MAG: hypothetical protein IPF60_11310 [Betaproteobacteria bacterium]|nr:hypothetical protein [Betaproteobacteria bacterium]
MDIDFGNVPIAMRNPLRTGGKKPFSPGTALAMFLPQRDRSDDQQVTRKLMIGWGYCAQAPRLPVRAPPA